MMPTVNTQSEGTVTKTVSIVIYNLVKTITQISQHNKFEKNKHLLTWNLQMLLHHR